MKFFIIVALLCISSIRAEDEFNAQYCQAKPFEGLKADGTERTLVLIKPDGIKRGLIGRVLQRFEDRQFRVIALRMMHASQSLLEKHYDEHRERPFFKGLVERMSSGPVVMIILEGPNVIGAVRKMIGSTNPINAEPGTIRGDFCIETEANLIHASDSAESAEREILLWNGC